MTAPSLLERGDRVLVTRLNYLGDVVLSLPLVDALHARFPGIEIDYLARRPGADLLAGDARFARVLPLEAGVLAGVRAVRALRERRYRAVVDLYSNPRSAWLSWLTGAPVRVGGDRRGRRRLYTHPVRVPSSLRSVTDVFLFYGTALGLETRAAGKPSLALTPSERSAAEQVLAGAGAGAGRVRVGVHPGGKWTVKRWPADKFAALVELVRARSGAEVVLFTGPGERDATRAVQERCPDGVHVLPVLEIRTAAAVIAHLDAMVACDGGIMHVAVAVGTPTVGIFGSSECEVWFPYESFGPFRAARVAVPCRPCHRHECPLGTTACLMDLSVESVWGDLERVLAEGARARSASR
jgi:lipopolysaccharide heptosyltransferase II